jgi:hypothetical protein
MNTPRSYLAMAGTVFLAACGNSLFDPTVDGETRDFIVSGLLYRSNLVMLDEQSETLWDQMLLGSQCGMDRGKELRRLPVVETDWGDWKSRYPNTTILNRDTGFNDRPYFQYPYGNYAVPDNDFVEFLVDEVTWQRDLKTKELVLGVFEGGARRSPDRSRGGNWPRLRIRMWRSGLRGPCFTRVSSSSSSYLAVPSRFAL